MQSSPFSLPASRPPRSFRDPVEILMPLFIGALRAAPFAAFFAMYLGPDFGMSNGLPAPNVWALAVINAIGFWSVRFLPKVLRNPLVLNIGFIVIGIAAWVAWMALEPEWHIAPVLRNPILMATEESQFSWVFIITIIFWVLTLRLALDEREQSPEGVRGIMVRSLVFVLAATLLAGFIGGQMGEDGIRASYAAIAVAMVSGIGAVGLSEMASTRATARRRGATIPGWDRWGRSFLGTAAAMGIVMFVAALVFGPGFLALVVETLSTIWSAITTVLLYIMYGIVYVFVYIFRAIIWLMNWLFGTEVAPIEMPDMGPVPEETPGPMPEQGDREPWKYAGLLRFGGIALLVVIALIVLARFARYRMAADDTDGMEERSSVFSGSLLRKQLRDLFRRRGHEEKPRKLDLASDPATVRESMLYLQVLAERLGTARIGRETPYDFAHRLGDEWPAVRDDLAELARRYENVRYGESEEDRLAAVAAWRNVWVDRSQVEGAGGSP